MESVSCEPLETWRLEENRLGELRMVNVLTNQCIDVHEASTRWRGGCAANNFVHHEVAPAWVRPRCHPGGAPYVLNMSGSLSGLRLSSTETTMAIATYGIRAGRWAYSVTVDRCSASSDIRVGFLNEDLSEPVPSEYRSFRKGLGEHVGDLGMGFAWSCSLKTLYKEGSKTLNKGREAARTGKTVVCLLDLDAGRMTWYVNNADVGVSISLLPRYGRRSWFPAVSFSSNARITCNFTRYVPLAS